MGEWMHRYIFLILVLVEGEWSASCSGRFTFGERAHGTHWIAGWVGLRSGLDDVEKILDPNRTRTPTHPSSSCSQSLYRFQCSDEYTEILGAHLCRYWKHSKVYQKILLKEKTFFIYLLMKIQASIINGKGKLAFKLKTKKLNSVACSPQANYSDRAAAAC
jgi:hypothetical protein